MEERLLDLNTTSVILNRRIDWIEEHLEKLKKDLLPIDFSKLNFRDSFYLYCILNVSGDIGCDGEVPDANSSISKLAPTCKLTREMYYRMHEIAVFVPSLRSPISAFNISAKGNSPISFDVSKVRWTMANDQIGYDKKRIMQTLRTSFQSCAGNEKEALATILVQHECLAQLMHYFNRTPINMTADDEREVFHFVAVLLNKHSPQFVLREFKSDLVDPLFGGKRDPEFCNDEKSILRRVFMRSFDRILSLEPSAAINRPSRLASWTAHKCMVLSVFFEAVLGFD